MVDEETINRLKAFLKPPRQLLGLVRWIFLLSSLLMAVLQVPLIIQANVAGWPLRVLAIASLSWLCWRWVHGYRNMNFSPLLYVPEGMAIFTVALAVGAPPNALGLIYSGLMFRSLYGTRRSALVMLLVYLAAFYGAVALSLSLANFNPNFTVVETLPHIFGLTLMAVMLHILATILTRHERALVREKVLSNAGAALVAAQDRESVYETALDAALELTKGNSKVQVGLATGSSEKMTVVASAGYQAAEIRGDPLDLCALPDPLRTRFLNRETIAVEHHEDGDLRKALGLSSAARPFFVVPLFIEHELKGIIGVTSESPLTAESKDGLKALGFQVALALESVAFAEDRHWRQSEVRFRSLIQNSSDIIMVLGADGAINYVSPSVRRMLGYAPEDLIGEYNFTLLHPDDVARVRNFHAKEISTPGAAPALETRLRHSDGSWRYVEGIGNNLLDDPDVRGIVINMRDTTERKRAEEESQLLRTIALEVGEAEDLDAALRVTLQRVCEAANWAIGQAWIPNADGTALECSPAWYARANELAAFRSANEDLVFEPGKELPGIAWKTKRPAWSRDITMEVGFARAPVAEEFGLRAGMDIPVLVDSEVVAVLDFFVFEYREEDERLIELIAGITTQLGSVIQRKRAEEASRKSEARYRAVVNTASDAIVTMSEDGLIRSFNLAAERIFGYRTEETVGQSLRMLMPERYRSLHEAGFRRYLETNEAHMLGKGPVELAGLRKDGTEFPLELSLGEIRGGEETLLTGIIRDVSERKQAENKLRASESNLAKAQRIAHLGSWDTDLVKGEVRWSDELFRILGFTPGEVAPSFEAVIRACPPQDREYMKKAIQDAFSRREPSLTIEHRILRPDGEVRFVQAQIETVFDEHGKPIRKFGTLLDITDRKQADNKLRASESSLAEAQRIAHLGSWEINLMTGEMHWSDEMYRVFGFTPGEVTPTREVLEKATHPQDRDMVQEAIRDAVQKRQPFNVEHRTLWPNGEVRVIHAQGEAVLGPDGRPVKLVGTSFDITERKRTEEELRRSESRLLAAQRIAHVGNWSFDVINNEAHWSDEMYRIFGLDPQEEPTLSYKGFLHRVHPGDRRLIQEASREALSGESRSRLDYRAVRPDGEVRFVHSQYEIKHDASGQVIELIGTLQDITELRQAEEELRRSEERFRSLVQHSLDVITVVDTNATVLYYSPSVETVMGYKPEEFIGKNALEVVPIHPDDLPRIREVFSYLVENPGVNYSMELRMRHADGSWRVTEATANNLLDDPSVGGIVTNYRDITERKRAEEQLEHQAFHDDLTGLPNRALLMDRLEHALARAYRQEGRVAVLFLDLDNFKVINDSLGHKAGDELLVAVAERLQEYLRPADTVARLSGDEFIVLLEDATKESKATRLAERLIRQLQTSFKLGDRDIHVTTSIGIAFGTSSDDPDELLRKADIAMYRAKSRGKAHYKVFDEHMDAEAHKRLSLETELRRAIEREEFRVYYQPKVQLETGEISEVEALVRWEHPERGLVLPAEFIPIAEEAGLIHQIGRWVLREACRQAREWKEQNPGETPITVSVNLSAKQFQHAELIQDIARILRETGIDEHLLCLEITESVAMEEAQSTIATLNKLKDLSIKLAIDDFGTGYSSLSYLKRFSIDYLKIDRSLVTGIENDRRNWAIVLATITVAHALDLRVVAEGVETAGELARLRALRCDFGQGYYFARPLPASAITSLLARKSPIS